MCSSATFTIYYYKLEALLAAFSTEPDVNRDGEEKLLYKPCFDIFYEEGGAEAIRIMTNSYPQRF